MTSEWTKKVLRNFNAAATIYKEEVPMQNFYAWEIAKECHQASIPYGLWADLGAGTGNLAEKLEFLHPKQKVIRVDGSQDMLLQNSKGSSVKAWDLNLGLPILKEPPTLIASSFALHWLENPIEKVTEWSQALAPGGILALAVPIDGSFQEWHEAASNAKVEYTAINLPSKKALIDALNSYNIHLARTDYFIQFAPNPISLLKSLVKIGAQTSKQSRMNVTDVRSLNKSWRKLKDSQGVKLTWKILLILVKK
tara:strand:- start:18 stop:773 length:756 start_codon:yes stop_codon:yes gene_type:complete